MTLLVNREVALDRNVCIPGMRGVIDWNGIFVTYVDIWLVWSLIAVFISIVAYFSHPSHGPVLSEPAENLVYREVAVGRNACIPGVRRVIDWNVVFVMMLFGYRTVAWSPNHTHEACLMDGVGVTL